MKWFLCCTMLVIGIATTPVGAAQSALEQLDAVTALAEVRSRSGVVFVDLYADW